jgi:hypothetical protein
MSFSGSGIIILIIPILQIPCALELSCFSRGDAEEKEEPQRTADRIFAVLRILRVSAFSASPREIIASQSVRQIWKSVSSS